MKSQHNTWPDLDEWRLALAIVGLISQIIQHTKQIRETIEWVLKQIRLAHTNLRTKARAKKHKTKVAGATV